MQRNEEYGFTWADLKFDRQGFDIALKVNLTDLSEALNDDLDDKAITDLAISLVDHIRSDAEFRRLAGIVHAIAEHLNSGGSL
jgi:hypothetical protein